MLTAHCFLRRSAWHARGLEAEHHIQHPGVPTGLPVAEVAAREVVRACSWTVTCFYSVMIYQLYWQITSDEISSTVDFVESWSSIAAAGTVRTLQSGACSRTTLLVTLAPTRLWRRDMPQHAQLTTHTCQLCSHCNCRRAGPTPVPTKPKPAAPRRE
jgi:hypothetical protein